MIKIKEVGSLILCSTSSGGTSNKNRVDLGTILRSSGSPRGSSAGSKGHRKCSQFSRSVPGASWEALGVVFIYSICVYIYVLKTLRVTAVSLVRRYDT